MAELDLGRIRFFDKGEYSVGAEYVLWDFVTSNGSTYLYINKANSTGKPMTDEFYWKCLAKRGLSAFEVWDIMNGGNKTEAQFFDFLQSPANDAKNNYDTVVKPAVQAQGVYAQAQGDYAKEKGDLVADVVENESERVQNEAERISKEGVRQSSEIDRIEAEGVRVQAESERQITIQEAVTATNLANDKITEIDEVVIPDAELATQNANDVKTDYETVVKPDMIAKANYAREQGDYAKDQGDILNNRLATFYGCEWQKGGLDAQPIRWIGDERYQTDHVIFNDFKVAKVKDGKVVGILNQTNWFEMEDGTPSGIVIDGTDVTDDGCDIMLVNEKGFYVLNGGTDPDFERRIVSDAPFHYGNDRAIYIEPFGMTVDFAIVKGGVSRCIRDNTHSGTAITGNGGVSYLADGLGVPTTYISRFGAEGYARAKNVDTSLNTPYANTFQLDKNVWATLLFIKFQTKDLHNQDCVGPCISANDSAPNIWGDKTGIRVKNVDETYSHYNTNSSRFMSAVGRTSWNFYQLINNYRPLLKIFDCQLALSHAKQNNIPQNTLFEFDGFQYSYENIQGSKGIADGEMTAKVRKFVTVQFTGYDNVDKVDVVDKDVEYCFEQGVVHGKIAGWGNIWEWVSGLEGVIDGDSNSRYYFYQTDDVRKLTTDSDSTDKENGEVFAFQNSYDYLGSDTNTNGYVRQMFDNSLMGMILGGSLHTAECGYRYSSTSADVGKLIRRGVFFGGNATHTACALRAANANNAPTLTSTNVGFGFRVTLP